MRRPSLALTHPCPYCVPKGLPRPGGRGAAPSSLPVERPGRYYLTINLKTAKALGLALPESLLLRANQVIDP